MKHHQEISYSVVDAAGEGYTESDTGLDTFEEAAKAARAQGWPYVVKRVMQIDEDDQVADVKEVFIRLADVADLEPLICRYRTLCTTCNRAAIHSRQIDAENWSNIHRFENEGHKVERQHRTRHGRGAGRFITPRLLDWQRPDSADDEDDDDIAA